MAKGTGNISLKSGDSIFKSTVAPTNGEQITEIPLTELHPPEFHPFSVVCC